MKRKPVRLPEEVVQLLAPFFPGFDLSRIRVHEGVPRYVIGDPVAWFYDPPWTLPFLRRNEIAVPVRS